MINCITNDFNGDRKQEMGVPKDDHETKQFDYLGKY